MRALETAGSVTALCNSGLLAAKELSAMVGEADLLLFTVTDSWQHLFHPAGETVEHWDFKLEESTLTIRIKLLILSSLAVLIVLVWSCPTLGTNTPLPACLRWSLQPKITRREEKEGCLAAGAVNCPSVW